LLRDVNNSRKSSNVTPAKDSIRIVEFTSWIAIKASLVLVFTGMTSICYDNRPLRL
jgi:hypothetical protein